MKSRNTLLIGFLLIFVVLSGCTSSKGAQDLKLSKIERADYTEELMQWHNENWDKTGTYTKVIDNETYILIVGEQVNTGGYSIEILSATYEGKVASIKVEVIQPPEDSMTTQALDYPHVILKTEVVSEKVEVSY